MNPFSNSLLRLLNLSSQLIIAAYQNFVLHLVLSTFQFNFIGVGSVHFNERKVRLLDWQTLQEPLPKRFILLLQSSLFNHLFQLMTIEIDWLAPRAMLSQNLVLLFNFLCVTKFEAEAKGLPFESHCR